MGEALGGTAGGVERPEEEMRWGHDKSVSRKLQEPHTIYVHLSFLLPLVYKYTSTIICHILYTFYISR